jgi:3-hydroxy-3-methylglutaryl CoA synthase/NAD(P)-dependent dehydrogenase (short-subunit alcohol dehydrogenase family)/putative sterol carrier protein
MNGIVSYGAYIPRLRLSRASIYQQMSWLIPATAMVAQGERSMCNWDEDSLTMAVAAARYCLEGLDRQNVEAILLGSTTLPFADRLNAGVAATALNLREDIQSADITSSQRAGTAALLAGLEAVKSGERSQVLVAAADARAAKAGSFYEMWFGDGAGALLLGEQDLVAEFLGSHSLTYDFVPHYRAAGDRFDYVWEERWMRDEGYAKMLPQAIQGLMGKLDLSPDDVAKLIYPCFFTREHAGIARTLGFGAEKVMGNLHEVCGETGTAHPLVMLIAALEESQPGDLLIVAGFGQGCDALCFRVTEGIRSLPARHGTRAALAQKKTTENYLKFLSFRDLVITESGIRAEAPSQTAMTTLWRKRKMILGLVGGVCRQCGTPQYPKMEICVNPACGALHSQDDYEFADIPATVKSFTADMLAYSIDPPAIYGMVQFEGGGRLMADFTDCVQDDIRVGMPVRMAFRKHAIDRERGFTGYFWKAVPEASAAGKGEEADAEAAEAGIRFDGRVAIVTGGGGGLGRAYALELARRGAKVVVNDLGGAADGTGKSKRAADRVVEEIEQAGGEAVANYDTVATVEGGESIVQAALGAYGRVDILINNAGILRDKSFAKMTPEMWVGVLGVHLGGAYNVTAPAFRVMRERGYGRIVLTTSAAGLFGNFGQANYGAAKMGLVGLMNTLKLEGEKYNVKVNTVAPLAVTRLTEGILPGEYAERLTPEAVAPLVLYLCSEQCAESGLVLNAGMGYFSRAAVVSAPGLHLGKQGHLPSVEDIHRNWDKIDSLEGAQEYRDANAALLLMLGGPQEGEQEAGGDEAGGGSVGAVFAQMAERFDPSAAAGVDVVFQFSIAGPGGGDWNVTVKDGACEVEEGVHAKPTTTLKIGDADFLKLVGGELGAMQAYTSGKLKIEGDLMKSQLVTKLFGL